MSVVEKLVNRRVLCVGDVMMDRFITGSVKRISPESPTPILLVESDQVEIGGAGNVARNVVALGGVATIVGVVGDDRDARKLAEAVKRQARLSTQFVVDPARPTTEKIRFVAQKQTMLRVDSEVTVPISSAIEDELIQHVHDLLRLHDVLVLSDYSKGVLTDRLLAEAIAAARKLNLPIVVDPKTAKFARYAGATVITPNVQEIALATGIDPATDTSAETAAEQARQSAQCHAILLTRSEKGMTLVRADQPPVHIKATAREVFDVVGAGDTVVGTLAMCLAAGLPLEEGAAVANAAAGIVVGKQGTAVVSPKELTLALSEAPMLSHSALSKIMDIGSARKAVDAWKKQGYKVGFTNGCFDVLHAGHIRLVDFVRANSERVVIGLNSNASVTRLKGPTRPINEADDRALLLASLGNVDAVVIFEEDTPAEIIRELLPDVLVKGADYQVAEIVGAEVVLANGGSVLRCDLVPGLSTTNILARSAAIAVAAGPE